MQTQVLNAHNINSSRENIRLAADILCSGGLVVFPTETVYGIGADGLNAKAVERIFAAKGRPQDNPLILHIANPAAMEPLVALELIKKDVDKHKFDKEIFSNFAYSLADH